MFSKKQFDVFFIALTLSGPFLQVKHVLFTYCSLKSFAERKLFNSTRQKCLFNFMGGIENIKKKICFLIMFKPDISYKRIGT